MALFYSTTNCDEKLLQGTRGGREPEAGRRACLSYNKVTKKKYVTLINKATGKVAVVDNNKNRLRRMQRRIKDWADLVQGKPGRFVMYTLTYKPGLDYRPLDIRNFMVRVKRFFKSKLVGYAWVAELQERGAIHYHVLLYISKGITAPYPDKKGWWGFGMSSVTTARSPYYLVKYTGKAHQKDFDDFPVGCRVFATWIKDHTLMLQHRYNGLKSWLRAIVDGEGWQAVNFYKKLHSACNEWVAWNFSESVEGALQDLEGFWDIYKLKELSLQV